MRGDDEDEDEQRLPTLCSDFGQCIRIGNDWNWICVASKSPRWMVTEPQIQVAFSKELKLMEC